MRESVSFKKNEEHIRTSRDKLCKYYKLNKSDLYKYLILKDSHLLEIHRRDSCEKSLKNKYTIDLKPTRSLTKQHS